MKADLSKYVICVMIALLFAMPAFASSVVRSMPANATPGSTINVSLNVMLDGATYYLIDEVLPSSSWMVNAASNGGDRLSQPGHILWFCLQGCANAALTYNVSIPSVTDGTYAFSGEYQMEGMSGTAQIGGANALNVAQPVTVSCGNGLIDAGEACDGAALGGKTCASLGYASGTLSCNSDCTINTGSCQYGVGGGGDETSRFIVTLSVGPDSANLTAQNVPAGTDVEWLNTNLAAIKINQVNVAPKLSAATVYIMIRKISLPSGITALTNAYQYFNFTPFFNGFTMEDADLSEASIIFAVENSWLTENDLEADTVALYRFVDSEWTKLATDLVSSDATYTYYDAVIPGFSYFAIASEKPECPSCPQADEWSVCTEVDGSGSQTRTEYECSEATNFTCEPTIVTQGCCLECQAPSDWSICINSEQTRTAYQCNVETGYVCEQYTETQDCIDAATAKTAISSAQSTIAVAKASGKDVADAETLLVQAKSALSEGQYDDAYRFAVQAENSALAAPQPPALPLIEIGSVIVAIVVAAAVIAVILKKRKRLAFLKPSAPTITEASVCTVCGQLTASRIPCSVCGQYACTKHTKTVKGKSYCTNCAEKI